MTISDEKKNEEGGGVLVKTRNDDPYDGSKMFKEEIYLNNLFDVWGEKSKIVKRYVAQLQS
jgi:hypothetical protein